MPLSPGTWLGHNIVLERKLGGGGMGEVWVAQNRALGNRVAVKVLHRNLSGHDEALGRFHQEARAVAAIDSPHVVQVFDFGMTPEHEPYIVMELLSGRDLREVIEQSGPLPVPQAVEVFHQLCRALGRAHELGVVHRDIKPENVFIVESDGEPFVKVLDFGIAHIRGDESPRMTKTGAVMGTPLYMSPEQFLDPRRVDQRSDLWSAAVVAYESLLGSPPFWGETIASLFVAVQGGSFELPSRKTAALPVTLDAFFQRALQVDPSQRYASARELATAFGAAAGSVPSSQAPHLLAPTTPAPLAPAPQTPGPLTPAPSASAPHTSAALAYAQTQPQAAPPSHRPRGLLWLGGLVAVLALGSVAVVFALPSLRGEDARTADASDEDDAAADEDDASSSPGKRGKKGKKKNQPRKRDRDDGEPGDRPADPSPDAPTEPADKPAGEPSLAPDPSPAAPAAPSSQSPTPTSTLAPDPAPAPLPPAPPAAPKPEPVSYVPLTIDCAAKNKTCPSGAACCPRNLGGGPRDIAQYDKTTGRCRCFRPVCQPGQSWASDHCRSR